MNAETKTFVSIVVPCYNEEAILPINLTTVISTLEGLSYKYNWEIVLINDGSLL